MHTTRNLLAQVWRGKTLTRAMMNARLAAEPPLTGITIDLGGGGTPSYLSILKLEGTFINIDRIKEAKPTIVGDIERGYPIASASIDTALLLNTLEHVYAHQHVVSEMRRILKPGGRAVVYVPFMFPVHTHQTTQFLVDDFFRYSENALRRIFSEAGFSKIQIEPQGGLCIALAEYFGFFLPRWFWLRPVILLQAGLAILLQKPLEQIRPSVAAKSYPLAYYVTASA